MADEQPPQSDLIDDAIRNAERQLEEKLEALRMSALGEHSAPDPSDADDVAVLRPTGVTRSMSEPDAVEPVSVSIDAADEDQEPTSGPAAWREADGDDVTFAPIAGTTSSASSDLYVPELDSDQQELDDSGVPAWTESDDPGADVADVLPPMSPSVVGLSASWDDAEDEDAEPWSEPASSEQPERPRPLPGLDRPAAPSADELQFWAQTSTALRNLQQVTDVLPQQVSQELTSEVARIVQDEIAPSAATLRLLQQQLQQGLPKLAERIEGSLDQAMTSPANGLRQIRDELPVQSDRIVRESRSAMREELDTTIGEVHGAVRQDISKLEQSIATNVTRMTQGTGEQITRVERDVDLLGESLVRFERGVHSEFDRVEAQLRSSIEKVDQSVREELVESAQLLRKVDDELPTRFGRLEHTVIDQVQQTQRDLSEVLLTLVDTTQAAVDRLGSLSASMDTDRAQRAEDVELLVDTVTTGWEGLAGAVKALFEQGEEQARRIAAIEQRLTQLRDLEGAVEETMDAVRKQVATFEQTPVVVTVTHPDAQVQQESR